ncbi:hypothetical protein DTO169E5_2161 [Paecilomyces variotii]|nr:hypothetical protein DTO169E5_2161 [Paecilomyces variotii]
MDPIRIYMFCAGVKYGFLSTYNETIYLTKIQGEQIRRQERQVPNSWEALRLRVSRYPYLRGPVTFWAHRSAEPLKHYEFPNDHCQNSPDSTKDDRYIQYRIRILSDHPRRSVIPSFVSSDSELADTTPPGIINDAATEPSQSPTPSSSVHDADAKEPSKWSLGSKRPPRCLKKLSTAMSTIVPGKDNQQAFDYWEIGVDPDEGYKSWNRMASRFSTHKDHEVPDFFAPGDLEELKELPSLNLLSRPSTSFPVWFLPNILAMQRTMCRRRRGLMLMILGPLFLHSDKRRQVSEILDDLREDNLQSDLPRLVEIVTGQRDRSSAIHMLYFCMACCRKLPGVCFAQISIKGRANKPPYTCTSCRVKDLERELQRGYVSPNTMQRYEGIMRDALLTRKHWCLWLLCQKPLHTFAATFGETRPRSHFWSLQAGTPIYGASSRTVADSTVQCSKNPGTIWESLPSVSLCRHPSSVFCSESMQSIVRSIY